MSKNIRFRNRTVSFPSPISTPAVPIHGGFIDYNAPKTGTEICRHEEIVPPVPKMSPDLMKTLDHLEKLNRDIESSKMMRRRRRRKIQNTKPSKMNRFTAYKSYYTKNYPSVHQAMLSSVISKAWAADENKEVWDIYASIFRRYKRNETFSEWLNRTAPQSNDHKILSTQEKEKEYPIIEFNMESMVLANPFWIDEDFSSLIDSSNILDTLNSISDFY